MTGLNRPLSMVLWITVWPAVRRDEEVALSTYAPKAGDVDRKWYVIDASGKVLGRLAAEIARRLRGKHKPEYTPHMDMGDYIIVINADKISVTGKKMHDKKYYRHSGFPGGIYERSFQEYQE